MFESTENIKELEIAAGLESLEGLGLFPSLEKLHLDCYGLADIRELANAKSVRELTLENGDDVKDFSVLSVMTWLEGLYIDSENLKALTFLSNMTQLKTLGIERGGLLNLNGLATRADTLTGLTIDSCGELSDCNEVSALTGLTSLSIELPYNCKEPDLSGMTAMEELEISGFSTVSFLHSMPEIKKLKLNSSAVDDKSVFGALQKLEELKCGSFSASKNNLDFIAGLPALKKLDLTGAATYSDISAIFNMPTLEILLMDGVECEINFDKLQDNPALKTLSMDGIKLDKNRFTASSIEMRKRSGLRSRASASLCVSLSARRGVEVWSTRCGYRGEKRSVRPPSTTSLPSPMAMLHIPSSGRSSPMG